MVALMRDFTLNRRFIRKKILLMGFAWTTYSPWVPPTVGPLSLTNYSLVRL